MEDFFNSLLGGNDASLDSKKLSKMNQVDSPIIFKTGENPKVTLILDEYISPRQVTLLKTVLENNNLKSYQLLYAVKVKFTEKDLSTGIWKKYRDFAWDYSKYIPKWSSIISFGRSLYSITKSNDLDCSLLKDEDSSADSKSKDKFPIVNGFYDHLLWKTSFYDPKTSCQVFPVDEWRNLINKKGLFKNSWEYYFLTRQIQLASGNLLKPTKIRKIKTIEVENPNEWLKEHTQDKQLTGLDIETSSFDPWSKKSFIICITVAFSSDPYTGYYLDNAKVDSDILIEFLKDRPLVGSNFKFDGKFLHLKHGVPLENLRIAGDTVQLSHITNEMMRKGLKAGAFLWTEYGGYDEALDKWKEEHPKSKSYADIPKEILLPYATTDPCISLLVHKAMYGYMLKLDKLINYDNPYGYSLEWSYCNIVVPSLNLFMKLELEGINLDKNILKQKEFMLLEEIKQIEADIHKELGEDVLLNEDDGVPEVKEHSVNDFFGSAEYSDSKVNTKISSAKQLGHKLEEMGLPIFERASNKERTPKTGEEQLREWSKKGYAIADKILYYREKSKLLSTYVGVEKDNSGMYYWQHDDEKIHSQYNCFSALSWRHTSAYPNAQNFPSHGDKASLVKSFITPPKKDYGFLSTDFAGLQLRLIAMTSKDPVMMQSFKHEGGDLHSRTAYDVMLKYMTDIKSIDEMQKIRKGEGDESEYVNDMRFKSKAINFSCVFGARASTIMTQSIKPNWKPKDADKYIAMNKLESEVHRHLLKIENNEYRFIPNSTHEENILNAKYYTISVDVREKFFVTYAGVARWIEETRAFAVQNGYVKSLHGSIRRLPYLLVPNTKGSEDVNMGYYSNLLNVCLNSPIQNMEAIVMNRAFLKIDEYVKANSGIAKMFGQIHDAMEQYAKTDKWVEYALLVHKIAEQDYPEYDGIPLEVESNFADYFGKGELWDMGSKFTTKKLEKMRA